MTRAYHCRPDAGFETDGHRVCTKCEVRKPLVEFPWSPPGVRVTGRFLRCGQCRREAAQAWGRANLERRREKGRESYGRHAAKRRIGVKIWAKANPLKVKSYKLKKFGLSVEAYHDMHAAQGHSCACCGVPASEAARALAVDHCHKTGKVRGLLCSKCNNAIGLLYDNPETMLRLVDYLAKPPALAALHATAR